MSVCEIKYKNEQVGDIQLANYKAENDTTLATNIAEMSDFQKSLIKADRLAIKNNRPIVFAKNMNRSSLFDGLYLHSNNPLQDYEFIQSNDFKSTFGDWHKAQDEWLSGKKTYKQAVRSNKLDESLIDNNLEPLSTVLYPNSSPNKSKLSNKDLSKLFDRANTRLKLVINNTKSDRDLILDNYEEAERLLPNTENLVDTIISFRPDILNQLRELDNATKSYYQNNEVVYKLDSFELNNILNQLNIKKLCL